MYSLDVWERILQASMHQVVNVDRHLCLGPVDPQVNAIPAAAKRPICPFELAKSVGLLL